MFRDPDAPGSPILSAITKSELQPGGTVVFTSAKFAAGDTTTQVSAKCTLRDVYVLEAPEREVRVQRPIAHWQVRPPGHVFPASSGGSAAAGAVGGQFAVRVLVRGITGEPLASAGAAASCSLSLFGATSAGAALSIASGATATVNASGTATFEGVGVAAPLGTALQFQVSCVAGAVAAPTLYANATVVDLELAWEAPPALASDQDVAMLYNTRLEPPVAVGVTLVQLEGASGGGQAKRKPYPRTAPSVVCSFTIAGMVLAGGSGSASTDFDLLGARPVVVGAGGDSGDSGDSGSVAAFPDVRVQSPRGARLEAVVSCVLGGRTRAVSAHFMVEELSVVAVAVPGANPLPSAGSEEVRLSPAPTLKVVTASGAKFVDTGGNVLCRATARYKEGYSVPVGTPATEQGECVCGCHVLGKERS